MHALLQVSAVLTIFVGLGFSLPAPWVLLHLRRTGTLPTFFDLFPLYGGPLFRRASHRTFGLALTVFAVACLLDVWAGIRLWHGDEGGARLTLALLPIEIAGWIAFALPIPPMLGAVRIALLVV